MTKRGMSHDEAARYVRVAPLVRRLGVSRLSGDRRAAPRTGGLRLIGVGVPAVVEGRIAETIAADTGRCRLALRHAIKAAAPHMPGDILTAKLGSTCLRGAHCTKGNRRE